MHSRDVQKGHEGERLTVGNVQKEIQRGMSGAEVAAALGSPNIVSTDENGWEVWIYDKIATDVSYSKSDAGIIGLVFGGSGGALGGAGYGSGASAKSQRTLTVVIKFDADKKVRDFAYHTSRF
jgi:outer membrane protein assembly factor BamE (lipoprotein component of BamABCDE complex)